MAAKSLPSTLKLRFASQLAFHKCFIVEQGEIDIMLEYKYLKSDFQSMPSEEKLQVLRHEILRIHVRLEAHIQLLLLIDKAKPGELQLELFETIKKIKEAINEIYDTVEALT